MNTLNVALFVLPAAGFAAAFMLTGMLRRYAASHALIDLPNERSSHATPRPRGGGMAIVLVYLIACTWILWSYPGFRHLVVTIGLAAAAMGLLGWTDDRRGLSPGTRLTVQLLVIAATVTVTGPVSTLALGGSEIDLGRLAWILTVFWVLWLTNLYNFMDGIDGLAAVQGAVAAGTMALWFAYYGPAPLALLCLALMGAVLGFLAWNWPPARIFMGDVGSLTLGALFGILSVAGAAGAGMPWTGFVILLSVFVADATFTLLRRIVRGEVITRAHRSHFYQRAVQAGWSHAQVTTAVLGANLLLAAVATAEVARMWPPGTGLVAAAVVVAALAVAVLRRERAVVRARGGGSMSGSDDTR